jgi:P27 family predicted phage terminase small subunit
MPKGGARIGAGRKPKHREVVAFKEGLATAPAWLSPAAKHFYRFYGKQLEESRVLTHADRDTLATYAAMLADIAALSREMQKKTFQRVVMSVAGEKTNPIVTQYQQAVSRSRMLAQDLGLTPASRSRVQVTAPKSGDAEQQKRDSFFARPARPTLVKGAAGGA